MLRCAEADRHSAFWPWNAASTFRSPERACDRVTMYLSSEVPLETRRAVPFSKVKSVSGWSVTSYHWSRPSELDEDADLLLLAVVDDQVARDSVRMEVTRS